ncbi:MAG: zinc-dependent alcohol dehydrogenase [Promethearchaeota archaeon]|jgi:propanol-preferring alcohol dehydrogenase
MRTAIVEEFGKISIKDIPKPSPGYEEALVKISTAGVCHSDLHLAKGHWPVAKPPFPLGHEGIGIVEELGPGAEKFVEIGDRVILGLGGTAGEYWCGACEYCLAGKPMFCPHHKNLLRVYSEYVSIWAKALVKLPDEINDREVPLACAGLTAYNAVKKLVKFEVSPGKLVAIIGAAGGLGHFAVQIAKVFGYKVIGVDIGPDKLEFIKKLGADYAIDASEAMGFIRKKFKGVYASLVFSSKIAGFELGLNLLKVDGVLIAIGLPASSEGKMSLDLLKLILKGQKIVGSLVGTVEEMRELVQLAAEGKVKTHIGRVANLSELNQVFEELEKGKFVGRAIIDNFMK